MVKGFKVLLALLVLGLVIQAGPARADEIADQLKEGLEAYQKGDYRRAVEVLNFSVGQIQQKMASKLEEAFPEPLKGWKAEAVSSQYAGLAAAAVGINVSRRYEMGDSGKEVEIQFMSDSPLLQGAMMFLANPALLAMQPNTKLVKIKGQNATERFNPQDREGEITVVMASRLLITIKGREMDKPDELRAYAEAIRFDVLQTFLQN